MMQIQINHYIIKVSFSSLLLSARNLINQPFNLYYSLLEPVIIQARKESINHDKKLQKIKKAK